MFGRDPPSLRAYAPGEARLPAVQHQLVERDEFLLEIKDCLHLAQQHYKVVYDGKKREVSFQPGQWVWLRLMHRPMASLEVKDRSKLDPKFYRPFKVLEQVNDVDYCLELPPGARLHNVFHVGLLKQFHGKPSVAPGQLPPTHHELACLELMAVTKSRLARGQIEFLVTWKGRATMDASWMAATELWHLYPSFQLEDKLLPKEGRDVMTGLCYARRGNRGVPKQGMTPADPIQPPEPAMQGGTPN
jgi:hypothetical protein